MPNGAVISDGLIPLVDEGLGNSAYLLDLGDRRALAVDAPRDLRAMRAAARRHRLTVAYAADTHLHADFLTGAVQLHADDGAAILASAQGARAFDHRGLREGDEVDLGGLTLRALATPGHTDEHLSFLLSDGSRELGVFTGGSLIVGAAARTDLLGDDRTEELTHAQYGSLRRLAALPEQTAVWPTHGAGSFCSAPPGGARVSTIGAERLANPLLAAPDAETFAARLRGGLGSYPAYFARLAEVNRRGPALLAGEPTPPALDAGEVRRALADGALALDVRPAPDYPAGHLPGSLSIPLRASFATWLGWLVPADAPLVIIRNADQDPGDILWPALNIGYEGVVGELAGGVAAWRDGGGELRTTSVATPARIDGAVLDVRQASEYHEGHLPDARHIELGELPRLADTVAAGPTVVMCARGERATTGASVLERNGHRNLSILSGGAADWATATGRRLETGA